MNAPSYSADRFAWSKDQARLLRARNRELIDRTHIANVIEQLGGDDVSSLRERITVLLTALLRWAFEVDHRSVGFWSTINAQRDRIQRILEDSPSLLPVATAMIVDRYAEAKKRAVLESGLFENDFPEGLPFLPAEVLDDDFMPDPYGDDPIRGAGWWQHRRSD